MIGNETLERGGDMPEDWLVELIKGSQDETQTLHRLGKIAAEPQLFNRRPPNTDRVVFNIPRK